VAAVAVVVEVLEVYSETAAVEVRVKAARAEHRVVVLGIVLEQHPGELAVPVLPGQLDHLTFMSFLEIILRMHMHLHQIPVSYRQLIL
jgi:hypothetical protein